MYRALWFSLLFGLALVALACGGGDDDDASPFDGGPADDGGSDGGGDGGNGDGDEGSGDDDGSGDGGAADFDGNVCDLLSEEAVQEAINSDASVEGIETPYEEGTGSCAYTVGGIAILLGVTLQGYEGVEAGWDSGFGFDSDEVDVDGAEAQWVADLSSLYVLKGDFLGTITFVGGESQAANEEGARDLAQELADNMPD